MSAGFDMGPAYSTDPEAAEQSEKEIDESPDLIDALLTKASSAAQVNSLGTRKGRGSHL